MSDNSSSDTQFDMEKFFSRKFIEDQKLLYAQYQGTQGTPEVSGRTPPVSAKKTDDLPSPSEESSSSDDNNAQENSSVVENLRHEKESFQEEFFGQKASTERSAVQSAPRLTGLLIFGPETGRSANKSPDPGPVERPDRKDSLLEERAATRSRVASIKSNMFLMETKQLLKGIEHIHLHPSHEFCSCINIFENLKVPWNPESTTVIKTISETKLEIKIDVKHFSRKNIFVRLEDGTISVEATEEVNKTSYGYHQLHLLFSMPPGLKKASLKAKIDTPYLIIEAFVEPVIPIVTKDQVDKGGKQGHLHAPEDTCTDGPVMKAEKHQQYRRNDDRQQHKRNDKNQQHKRNDKNQQHKNDETLQKPESNKEKPQKLESNKKTPQEPECNEEKSHQLEMSDETIREPEVIGEKPQEPETYYKKPQDSETHDEKLQEPETNEEKLQQPETNDEKPQHPEKNDEKNQKPEIKNKKPQQSNRNDVKPHQPKTEEIKNQKPERNDEKPQQPDKKDVKPGEPKSTKVTKIVSQNEFKLSLNVNLFSIDDIAVQLIGDKISIEIRRETHNHYEYHELHNICTIPTGLQESTLFASLHDGMLTVEGMIEPLLVSEQQIIPWIIPGPKTHARYLKNNCISVPIIGPEVPFSTELSRTVGSVSKHKFCVTFDISLFDSNKIFVRPESNRIAVEADREFEVRGHIYEYHAIHKIFALPTDFKNLTLSATIWNKLLKIEGTEVIAV